MNTIWSELADWFQLAGDKKPSEDWWCTVSTGESFSDHWWYRLNWKGQCSCQEGISTPAPTYCKMYHRTKPSLLRVTYLQGMIFDSFVLSGSWQYASHLHWRCTDRQLCGTRFYIYCKKAAEGILYNTLFPLRGAMREFFGTSELFLPYGHCECYNVSFFALVARKLRAMVQISSSRRLLDKHFTY